MNDVGVGLDEAKLRLKQERALRFAVAKLRELVDPGAPVARRARTLCPVGAVYECSTLARAKVRAGGVTRPSAEPGRAGHNIAMLPQVVAEALSLLRGDQVLKRTQPELVPLLCSNLEKLTHQELNESTVLEVEALGQTLRHSYLRNAYLSLQSVLNDEPHALFALEAVCDSLVSELRARGWSDESLREICGREFETADSLISNLRVLDGQPIDFVCYVAVTITAHRAELEAAKRFSIVDALPTTNVEGPPPPRKGPFAKILIPALDYRYAAEAAGSQVASVLGAAAVFVKTDILVRSSIVVVETTTGTRSVDAHLKLPRESRQAKPGQLERIARSAADVASKRSLDSIFDAIRHRQRAVESTDLESRFMLLWLGIERLCLGSPDHSTILESVRQLVPPAIALGKLRREITALRNHLARSETGREEKVGRSREALLELIRDADPRALTSEFYDHDVLATQWVCALQKDLRGADGAKVAEYFERSRERIEWQVLRLYRARNSVAHAARGPAWLTDLVLHAHFYLTQLIAICVEHRDEATFPSSAELLLQRSAQYTAFIALLRAQHRGVLETRNLLRPTALVGTASR